MVAAATRTDRTVRIGIALALVSLAAACTVSHEMSEFEPRVGGVPGGVRGPDAPADSAASGCGARQADLAMGIRWFGPRRDPDRRSLTSWCSAVGPAEFRPRPASGAPAPAVDSTLTVVTWNARVGGGDLIGFLGEELGFECEGPDPHRARPHFVLLAQEVHRVSAALPDRSEASTAPDRIAGLPPVGPRLDVAEVAHRCGLALFYVPSMRNGWEPGGDGPEDRGNAILSSVPLEDPIAIELPLEAQRRVSAVATAVMPGGSRLRVASLHYDVAGNILRVLGTGGSMRVRQNAGQTEVLESLDPDGRMPIVVAGDLNTWSYRETVILQMLETYPDSPSPGRGKTRGNWPPDHLFFRAGSGPFELVDGSYRVAEREFGSDHRPRLAVLRVR